MKGALEGTMKEELRNTPAGLFRNVDAQERFATFAKLGTFGNETQAVEVHVGTADDSDELFLCAHELVVHYVALQSGKSQSTGWFCDRTGLYIR
jgi:hypothetical protein